MRPISNESQNLVKIFFGSKSITRLNCGEETVRRSLQLWCFKDGLLFESRQITYKTCTHQLVRNVIKVNSECTGNFWDTCTKLHIQISYNILQNITALIHISLKSQCSNLAQLVLSGELLFVINILTLWLWHCLNWKWYLAPSDCKQKTQCGIVLSNWWLKLSN